ncbi:MAG TPA: 4Fe-4S dicluster domain-containing protein [Anaeromyxobacteraceae bacterium]|nr:4Fe-4S dicluster domain-containing protein [Anaeromyxobacteraceae bacterium]
MTTAGAAPTATGQRQLAMVMDLNKCIGCQTCTVSCKTQWTNRDGREYMYWNNVETRPGSGYPRKWEELGGGFDAAGALREGAVPSLSADYGTPWDFNLDEAALGKEVRPEGATVAGPNWDEDAGAGDFPNAWYFYLPRICNHCSSPSCLAACPRGAIFKRSQDGVVLVDQEKCEGLRYCIAGCPYKKIYFNPRIARSEKCIFCFPRVEKGLPPACAQQCVGRLRFVGYLDDREGQVWKLVHHFQVALPLHPEYGTQPNVFYVPPLPGPPRYDAQGRPIPNSERIPVSYLESLFGPGVRKALRTLEAEMARKKAGKPSELMDILIAFQHADMFRLGEPAAGRLTQIGRRGLKSVEAPRG